MTGKKANPELARVKRAIADTARRRRVLAQARKRAKKK